MAEDPCGKRVVLRDFAESSGPFCGRGTVSANLGQLGGSASDLSVLHLASGFPAVCLCESVIVRACLVRVCVCVCPVCALCSWIRGLTEHLPSCPNGK